MQPGETGHLKVRGLRGLSLFAEYINNRQATADAFDERAMHITDLQVVDVRTPGEVEAGAIPNAISIPVGQLPARLGELDPGRPTVVYCAGGYRSSVAASLLRHNGFADVSDILGGYGAWDDAHQNA